MIKVFGILPTHIGWMLKYFLFYESTSGTDPPAHACSPRLDGKPTYCPDERDLILDIITKRGIKGEIDIYNPYHLQSIQMMFQRNARKGQIERTATNLLML